MEQFKRVKHVDIRGLLNPEKIEHFKHLKSFEVFVEDFEASMITGIRNKLCNFQELQYCIIQLDEKGSSVKSVVFLAWMFQKDLRNHPHIDIGFQGA
ncbi:Protein CBG27190 [Caenorhabditis briggsae]|uniref:DUF38 domain-containing protein n=2 Tax=Caenorhabditis briggsae TaxID=6238 RepID=A0AAE9D1P4_CAEBR|nr:Protein CBG27190 [Caenorhabditis briggsae]ULT90784.1 hypothetical protein L3Y34_008831 [Caenorhabditis briggsae]UMM36561.1 hypothetical protein L5515_008669 [Caenorhabditis briggsae]CAS00653.1 Protein CBG27190 [Caenorhabditis briggsae]